jgi:hypothetical protein
MAFQMEKIFAPATGVDIVFNMNDMAPYSRSSIIYDADYGNREIIIAQPLTPFSKNTKYTELHLTAIVEDDVRRLRAGVACTHFRLVRSFPLANGSTVPAVRIKYELPIIEINIRSAFRLPLSTKFVIKGKILLNQHEYHTSRDFSIRDISLSGMGLLVPDKRGGHDNNPLAELSMGQELLIGVILINLDQDLPAGTLPIKAKVKRIDRDHYPAHTLVGLEIAALPPEKEDILNQFIHNAQIVELRRLSGRK